MAMEAMTMTMTQPQQSPQHPDVVVEFLDEEDKHLPRKDRRVVRVEIMKYDDFLSLPVVQMANCRTKHVDRSTQTAGTENQENS